MSLSRIIPQGFRLLFVSLLLAFSFLHSAGAQSTIRIPTDQPTIQAGINAASTGDTVLVAPGTYYESLDFGGKAITVVSSGGAGVTTLDGKMVHELVLMGSTQGQSVFDGFTVQNGYPSLTGPGMGDYGGGIDIIGNATVKNSVVTGIQSCGIDVIAGNVSIIDNHIFHNIGTPRASADCTYYGGGILIHNSIPYGAPAPLVSVTGNLVEENADGGIAQYNEALGAVQVNIVGNIVRNAGWHADFYGTGTGLSLNLPANGSVVSNNLISGNLGVGFFVTNQTGGLPSYLDVTNNTLYGNDTSSANVSSPGIIRGSASEMGLDGNYIRVYNNIIFGVSTNISPLVCSAAAYVQVPPVFDHNDIYSSSSLTVNANCNLLLARKHCQQSWARGAC